MRGDCSDLENIPPVSVSMSTNRRPDTESQDCSLRASPGSNGLTGQPIKEGNVYAIQNTGGKAVRIPVVLKIYASHFERYAVVSQDKAVCRDCGYINLKHCSVQASSPATDTCLQERGNVPSPFHSRLSSSPPSVLSSFPSSRSRSFSSSHCPSGSPPRNATPTHNQHWFELIPTKAEGQKLSFSVCSRTELEQWLSVLLPDMSDPTVTAPSPKVVLASSVRKTLGDANPHRVVSPKLGKKPAMPSLEEE